MKYIIELSEEDYITHSNDEWNIPLGLVDALQKAIPIPEGATNKDMFKAVFGYEPATDVVVCNKEDWCGASEPCNYCIINSDNIGREEDWWNAPYRKEGVSKDADSN